MRRVVHNGLPYESELYREVMHLVDSLSIPQRAVSAGDTLWVDEHVLAQVLSPSLPVSRAPHANEASVVLRITYGETVTLLTGDAEGAAESEMVARYGKLLGSDVVKVPHHGSSTSSTAAFLRAVTPDTVRAGVAVVSVSRYGRFGLPDQEVLTAWRQRGMRLLSTASEGAVWLRSDGEGVRQVDWRY